MAVTRGGYTMVDGGHRTGPCERVGRGCLSASVKTPGAEPHDFWQSLECVCACARVAERTGCLSFGASGVLATAGPPPPDAPRAATGTTASRVDFAFGFSFCLLADFDSLEPST